MNYRALLRIISIIILSICAMYLLIPCVKNYNKVIPNHEKKYCGQKIEDSQIAQRLNNDVKLLDVNRDSVNVNDVFNKKKLVLRFSILNCSDCIDAELENIMTLPADLIRDRIILLAFFDNIRDYIMFYRKLDSNIKIYLLKENSIPGFQDDNINRPIFFTVNPDLSIDNIYLPIKEAPHETQKYLTHITKSLKQ